MLAVRLETAFDLGSGSYASERRASAAPTVATTAVTSVSSAGRLLASSPDGDRRRRMIPRSTSAVVVAAARESRARLRRDRRWAATIDIGGRRCRDREPRGRRFLANPRRRTARSSRRTTGCGGSSGKMRGVRDGGMASFLALILLCLFHASYPVNGAYTFATRGVIGENFGAAKCHHYYHRYMRLRYGILVEVLFIPVNSNVILRMKIVSDNHDLAWLREWIVYIVYIVFSRESWKFFSLFLM